jgi:hypothetical protein
MKLFRKICFLFLIYSFFNQIHTQQVDYIAAVVEYSPSFSLNQVDQNQAINIMVILIHKRKIGFEKQLIFKKKKIF